MHAMTASELVKGLLRMEQKYATASGGIPKLRQFLAPVSHIGTEACHSERTFKSPRAR
jgi:hypothetical protein